MSEVVNSAGIHIIAHLKTMSNLYFDYAATTPLRDEVREAMMPYLTTEYGNPNSQYELGFKALEAIDNARDIIAKSINADKDEIFFTSGGSESNSWAIKEFYIATHFYGRTIIISPVEHHSILNACEDAIYRYNAQISYVHTDKYGYIDVEDLKQLLADREIRPLVSIMAINNELGTVQPIKAIGDTCRRKAVFHTDAVQAYGHMPIDVKEMNIDMMSASGHKIYGPKGIGFMYVRKEVQKDLHPLINGGQQERGMRGGTENVAGIVGLAKASELAIKEMNKVNKKNEDLRNMLIKYVHIYGGHINSPTEKHYSPNHVNFRFDDIRAEVWNEFLSSNGICISSGSACNSHSNEPSHVLTAIGLSEDEANESVRVTFGRNTTDKDLGELIRAIKTGAEMLKPEIEETTDEQYNRIVLGN